MRHRSPSAGPAFLGLECGATRTVALLADEAGTLCRRVEAGPANLRLLSQPELVAHFKAIARGFPAPTALGIGMAGVRVDADRQRVRAAAALVWPRLPCWVGNDLETALAAVPLRADGGRLAVRVLVISGTGSCCYGQADAETPVKVGGWGHQLGDRGSGYALGLQALRRVVHVFDATGRWPPLGARLLRALQLNEPDDLIDWLHNAPKPAVAALAVEVLRAWQEGDFWATALTRDAAETLAADATACVLQSLPKVAARQAGKSSPVRGRREGVKGDALTPITVEFILAGGVLLKQPEFAHLLGRRLRRLWPGARVTRLAREGAWGAVAWARREAARAGSVHPSSRPPPAPALPAAAAAIPIPAATGPSPTEQRNPRSRDLDRRSLPSAIELMLREDARIPAALRRQSAPIARAIRLIARAWQRGGRLFYAGAGTSGRLGVLDASECPPTFRAAPEMVQGIMAGGQTALWTSIEGAEDDAAAGAAAVRFRDVRRRDVVVGIAASGRTPFVWGALHAARQAGAATVLLCCNPRLRFARGTRPQVVIAPNLGPEVLSGSTRLKAGTATKLVLNLFTTLAMVRLGKVRSNLMVDLNPSNAKLRDRAVRIVRELAGADAAMATAALEATGWVVRRALARLGPAAPTGR